MTPVYGPFFTAVQSTGRKLIDYPLPVKNNRFIFDGNSFERAIKNSRPAALLFCNPHNPGGRVWTKSEIETIVKICVQNSVKIISDEIHSDIIFSPSVHTSILTVDDAKNISIAAHSAGKTFNTAGLDASFVMIPNPEIKALFDKEAAAGHTGNINIFGKTALCAALTPCGAEYKKLLIDHLKQSTSMVCRQLQEEPRIKVMVPEATYLVWADFSALGQWPAVMRLLLHDAKVALSGGTFFGPAGKGWFRINCAHPSSQLQPAVNRIIQTFNNSE
jgi:cystathionine beta-lyase